MLLLLLLFDNELIPDIDPSNTNNPHEIIKGLNKQGITTWTGFIRMDEDDIPKITKHVSGVDVQILAASIRVLNHIKQLVWKNITDKLSVARLASIYTQTRLDDYTSTRLILGRRTTHIIM